MGGGLMRALVPTVKLEPSIDSTAAPAAAPVPPTLPLLPPAPRLETAVEEAVPAGAEEVQASALEAEMEELDKDMLCPICKQIIKDAFLTVCGHTFCYMCIFTHLRNKSDCPRCARYLTVDTIFPNILLDKLLKKTSARQTRKSSSPLEFLRQALQQGCNLTIKELDGLLALLAEKKRKMEQEEAEANMQILLGFLYCLRKQKLEELDEIQADLQYISEDINAVEQRRMELSKGEYKNCGNLRMTAEDQVASKALPSMYSKYGTGKMYGTHQCQGPLVSNNSPNIKVDSKVQASSHVLQREDAYGCSDSQLAAPGISDASKRRIHSQFNDLQECYLQKRRNLKRQLPKQEELLRKPMSRDGYCLALEDFHSVLRTFTRYSRLQVVAELRQGDLFHSANIVSSIEFDRDDEWFATAGVSRCIKVFEFSSIVNEPADVHFPAVEMSTRSKLSCLSWNKYAKNHIASSDYEGIVTVWDVNTRQSVMEYEEHEKRAWSVDFSPTEPSMLVSGSDDCKVKIWCMRQEASALNIDIKANVCSVKYNPGTSMHVAVGSADHNIHYYDLRNISQPLYVFNGHRKAVSYVKFLSNNELASASTDSTLRLWDVKENLLVRMYKGHRNEKNFVGLAVNSEYIACGSERNEVYVYHKAISKPMARHRFSCSEADENEDAMMGCFFISAVCWKSDSPTILTANSQGTIKVFVLSA